ncbi:cyclic nucleotide-binding domain-containing protein [Chloroflexota bacterium]
MTHWMCTNCGYYSEGENPPHCCPECKDVCGFNNVTSYLPNVGEWHMDQAVAGYTLQNTALVQSPEKPKSVPPTIEAIPPVYIFGSLTEEQRQKIRALEKTAVFGADSIIFKQGNNAWQLYLVEEGRVSLYYELSEGTHIPITVVSTQGAFGWSALVRPYQFTATAIALCKTRVKTIERQALLSLMRNDSKMGLLIMQDIAEVIARRLRNLELELSRFVQEQG